jgi:hypothetical protein
MDQDYESNPHKWSQEELDSINQCAIVLQVRQALLQRLVWHIQHIDNNMMDEAIMPSKIDAIVLNIKASGHWFSTTETNVPMVKMPRGKRFRRPKQ